MIRRPFAFSLLCLCASSAAPAADYPTRPLRLIVPWVAGGGTDIVARIIAPKMIESGYAGFRVDSWRGMYVSAGTPQYAVTRLNRELVKIMHMPDVRQRVNASGFDPLSSTPEELDAFGKAEFAKWAKVVKTAGVRAE